MGKRAEGGVGQRYGCYSYPKYPQGSNVITYHRYGIDPSSQAVMLCPLGFTEMTAQPPQSHVGEFITAQIPLACAC